MGLIIVPTAHAVGYIDIAAPRLVDSRVVVISFSPH
jgi:hypothetical protein